MKVNKTNFGKLAGVGRQAITNQVTAGKLIAGDDGWMDTDDPINAAYLEKAKSKKKHPPKEKPAPRPKPEPEIKPPPIFDDLPAPEYESDYSQSDDMGELTIEKMRAEIKYKHEAAEAYRVKRLSTLGVLVEREQVRQVLGRFNAEQRIRLLELPGTIAPRLLALAKTGESEIGIAALIEDEISRAIESAKAVIERAGFL